MANIIKKLYFQLSFKELEVLRPSFRDAHKEDAFQLEAFVGNSRYVIGALNFKDSFSPKIGFDLSFWLLPFFANHIEVRLTKRKCGSVAAFALIPIDNNDVKEFEAGEEHLVLKHGQTSLFDLTYGLSCYISEEDPNSLIDPEMQRYIFEKGVEAEDMKKEVVEEVAHVVEERQERKRHYLVTVTSRKGANKPVL
eukprot:TRINITY_DN2334_c0_g1_i10.p1 TRINITY_DN2334_c0_g1~~TRINITY_DN2334_c0_g1_i10.p1  ORF type:complete len:195 (+),score=52.33 TRINITY_DN2334_c0_g1_i10:99-683(+)